MTNKLALPAKRLSQGATPPLKIVERTEIHEKTGEEIKVTEFTRGLVKMLRRSYKGFRALEPDPPARKTLEDHRERIRDRLESLNLPSDRNPYWKQLDDDSWVATSNPEGGCIHWIFRLDSLTEPLTEGRALAYHLDSINTLLTCNFDDSTFRVVLDCIQSSSELILWGPVNELASAGIAAKKSRGTGPAARKRNSEKKRHVVNELTREFWRENPSLEGDASNTAAHILERVNARLQAMSLSPLKVKTVTDYIREGLHSNLI
ncbi:MAG: hypothetical protein KIT15_02335 [Xanthobacteraceae bacterium]|nr:hypothetical protein [Xanthobacteraceae bacterium]